MWSKGCLLQGVPGTQPWMLFGNDNYKITNLLNIDQLYSFVLHNPFLLLYDLFHRLLH